MSVRNLGELGENLTLIVKRLLENQDLCKLLYYTNPDPLAQPKIENTKDLLHKEVRVIPYVGTKETAKSVVTLRVISGLKNRDNEEFKNITIDFQVITPYTQWIVKDENFRPFLILGEIQQSLQGKTVRGLGKMQGGDFKLEYLTDEISCYSIEFEVIDYD